VHPYDWTYTPFGYNGTLLPKQEDSGASGLVAEETALTINYEKLKEREQILFFDDVILYEDELDDNGCSKLSAKIVSSFRSASHRSV
jgi:type 2A phosphatase activator TIP41